MDNYLIGLNRFAVEVFNKDADKKAGIPGSLSSGTAVRTDKKADVAGSPLSGIAVRTDKKAGVAGSPLFGIAVRTDKKADATRLTVAEMTPGGLCPLFYHNLIPYISALLNDGWFRWVRREKDQLFRRPIKRGLFKDCSVNSAFPNEVLVACPSVHACVVGGVSVIRGKGGPLVSVRIMQSPGGCPALYKEGMEIRIKETDIRFDPMTFNSIFPYILASASGDKDAFVCRGPQDDVRYKTATSGAFASCPDVCSRYSAKMVSAGEIKGPCRYHDKPVQDIRVAPGGLCLDALHAIYPYGLALLYDASFDKAGKKGWVSVNCPGNANQVSFRVERALNVPGLVSSARQAAAKAFERVFKPVDLIDYRVTYKVEDVKGVCPGGLNKGDSFEFNVSEKKELCPASFHSVYPFLFLKSRGLGFDWGSGKEASFNIPCPDCMGAVYKI